MRKVRLRDRADGLVFGLLGGSNIGGIIQGREALVVDSGLDKESARKIIRALHEEEAVPRALLITHGHADHFGGAAAFIKRAPVPLYASPFEAHFIEEPRLEPLFLAGGAAPFTALRGKFTQAKTGALVTDYLEAGTLTIDDFALEVIPLPGHSPQQVGFGLDGVLFCGDALFPHNILDRHPILFCHDMDAWLTTLATFPTLVERYPLVLPGHGEPLNAEQALTLARANAQRLEEIRAQVWEHLDDPITPDGLLRTVADFYRVELSAPAFYLLSRTTIQAALTSLEAQGEAESIVEGNRWLWRRRKG